jgi:hypothetical protein
MDTKAKERLLLGLWRYLLPVPRAVWKKQIRGDDAQLDFMSADHHRLRNYCVVELPRADRPLAPEVIAGALSLSLERVGTILDELERHMTFLYRNEQGAVTWAYPVTVDRTPHRVTFSSGEQIYAA